MTDVLDHPALERLQALERDRRGLAGMGYQPSLDGLRAVSVIAVILYHAGFSWMHGGFFGVEVFFVVSGYLITSLLVEERERLGRVSLGQFWKRRARRLLPALFSMLAAVSVWAALWGSPEHQSQMRRDLPWSIGYVANWGQIVGGVPYFQPGSPSPLRHLWSLAVEEQWYLLWPLAFLGLAALKLSLRARGRLLVAIAVTIMALTWFLARAPELSSDRINFMYLGTLTRASGLLLGAGAAFLWRPWRRTSAPGRHAGRLLDFIGMAAIAALVVAFSATTLTDRSTYRWVLPLVTLASMAAVMVVVHPAAWTMRRLFGARPMVEVGKRSYGLYLWTWPITVICRATQGSWSRFAVMLLIAVPLTELCYRFVETPIRRGALGQWFTKQRSREWSITTAAVGVSSLAVVVPLALFFGSVRAFDPAADLTIVAFEPVTTPAPTAASVPVSTPVPDPAVTSSVPAIVAPPETPVATLPVLPRSVVVVGDSQAHSLAINLPSGIEGTFSISDGSLDGCSVYDDGSVVSARDGFSRSFTGCGSWSTKWAETARANNAAVALVVLGAWDVFDTKLDGTVIPFGSATADQRFLTDLQQGIDALKAVGTHVALLEVACMRPVDVKGAGVPALPERGDDSRVRHLNTLLHQAADADPAHVTFVVGPTAWCSDDSIAANVAYRWDGVHAYKPGAKLIYDTIAPALLAIPIG